MRSFAQRDQPAVGMDIAASAFTNVVGSITDRACLRECLRGVDAVIHTASLHKPHLATHSADDFVQTNVSGTLAVLEEAVAANVRVVIFTSTTSAFGAALVPRAADPATWITENTVPVPKNMYGVTKIAAENVCELFHRQRDLAVIVLRTSRFFPEPDDDPAKRAAFKLGNAQANELLHRRVDVQDVVDAHMLAIDNAARLGLGRFIISATTPFQRADAPALRTDAAGVVRRLFPDAERLYANAGWRLPESIDRVYDNALARGELGWAPRYDFAHALDCLRQGRDHRSPLAVAIGSKGYHGDAYQGGAYPVA